MEVGFGRRLMGYQEKSQGWEEKVELEIKNIM